MLFLDEPRQIVLDAEERPSDSPFVARVWRSDSYGESAQPFTSIAEIHYEMVVTKYQGRVTMTVRGPETQATPAHRPADAEWIGIQFKPGTVIPHLSPAILKDRCDVDLPNAGDQSFWLHGSAWEFPDFENADTFVDRLVRNDLLVHDPVVSAVLQGQPPAMSLRTVQRRFLQATGLTHSTLSQIKRAHHATALLIQGVPILDTVYLAGYADQPHLTRSLKHYIGQTPAQLADPTSDQLLSFLFETPLLEAQS